MPIEIHAADRGTVFHSMPWRFLVTALLACCFLLGGCKKAPATRQYAMHGEVLALNPQDHTATIKHGKIGDWMEAMTMEYPIKNEADWKKLAVGARIDATVFVKDASYYVGDVRVASAATPAAP